jgi:hypothetical protein
VQSDRLKQNTRQGAQGRVISFFSERSGGVLCHFIHRPSSTIDQSITITASERVVQGFSLLSTLQGIYTLEQEGLWGFLVHYGVLNPRSRFASYVLLSPYS